VSPPSKEIRLGFEVSSLRIPIGQIMPLRVVSDTVRKSVKYAQIAASIREVGIIEPPVVVRDAGEPNTFHLLDGHLRIEILKDQGIGAVVCLVSTDDEAYTYNKRINRLATIQEHRMILTAVEKGVSEERLARALNVNIASIRSRRRLLEGICPEAVDLLRDRHVPLSAFRELRRLCPTRQIEAAQLMVAMNRYTISYAKSLVAATPENLLVVRRKAKAVKGLTPEQIALMEAESANLQRHFKVIEQDYGADHLDLVLATGYVSRLLGNARVVGYLAQHHAEILAEFQKLNDLQQAA
jgi:ribosomal protein S15P/S13E